MTAPLLTVTRGWDLVVWGPRGSDVIPGKVPYHNQLFLNESPETQKYKIGVMPKPAGVLRTLILSLPYQGWTYSGKSRDRAAHLPIFLILCTSNHPYDILVNWVHYLRPYKISVPRSGACHTLRLGRLHIKFSISLSIDFEQIELNQGNEQHCQTMAGKSKSGFSYFCQIRWIWIWTFLIPWIWIELFERDEFRIWIWISRLLHLDLKISNPQIHLL